MNNYIKNFTVGLFKERKLPIIIQSEVSECGLACIAMIANFHGLKIDLISMRKHFESSVHGMSLKDIVIIGEKLNLMSNPVRVELNELDSLSLPCILHWSFNHFVVLKKISKKTFIIHDPNIGERRISYSEISNCFTGIALEMKPSIKFERKKIITKFSIWDMLVEVKGKIDFLVKVILISTTIELITLLIPLFSQFVIDNIFITNDILTLNAISVSIIALLLIRMLLSFFRDWIIIATKYAIGLCWYEGFLEKLISLPLGFFEKRYLGDIVSRLQILNQIRDMFTARMIGAVFDAIIIIFLLGMMCFYSMLLCSGILLLAMLYGSLKFLFFKKYKSILSESINNTANQSSHFIETVRGIATVKMLCLKYSRKTKWLNLSIESISSNIKLFRIDLIFRLVHSFITGVVIFLVIYGGTYLSKDGSFTIGILLAFMLYADMFIQRIMNFFDVVYEFKLLSMHTDKLSDVVLVKNEYEFFDAPRYSSVNLYERLDISALSFSYLKQGPYILHKISLCIKRGESIAFVGESGCGKSTLLHIIASLLKPIEGSVSINGISVHSSFIEEYRKNISYVLQNDFLFTGSLKENITCFTEKPDVNFMCECAKIASIHDEIVAMPNGYNTKVGDMGSTLSGGQKQRIFIARALYRKPQILILDEPTSALDIKNEHKINEAIKAMKITRLFAAHRPDAIAVADKVFDMISGCVMSPNDYLKSIGKDNIDFN